MRLLFALAAATLLVWSPARADVFTVRGVEVDETSDSAARARERAISIGQVLAARRLIERVTLPEDRAFMPPLDSAQVAPMVSGFQVEEEAPIGGRYVGRLTVAFDPDAIQDLLERSGSPYVLSTARPSVVVPVWRESPEVEAVLWDGINPWRDAWSVAGTSDELVPVLTPSGDLADLQAIDVQRALALDLAALERLAANYGSAHVLVALASPSPGAALTPGLDPLAPPLPPPVDPNAPPAAEAPQTLGDILVPAEPTTPEGAPLIPISARIVGVDFANGGLQTDYGSLVATDPVILARGVAGLLQDGWKRALVTPNPALTSAKLNVLYRPDSPADWMALQSVIGSEPLVQFARLDGVTNDGAVMTIEHRGTVEQLALALREHGAELTQGPQGLVATWVQPLGALLPGVPGGDRALDPALDPAASPDLEAAPTIGPAGETVPPGAPPGALRRTVTPGAPGADSGL